MELPEFIKKPVSYIKRQYQRLKSFITGKPIAANDDNIQPAAATAAMPTSPPTEIAVDVKPLSPLEKGKPCELEITLKDKHSGKTITENDLEVVHTKKLHLLVVDKGLNDYHHLHPEWNAEHGKYYCTFAPATDHGYNIWADFTLTENNKNMVLKQELDGKSIAPANTEAVSDKATEGGVSIHWQSDRPLQNGQDALVTVKLFDSATGESVNNLQPILGAYAHLVGFSADGQSILHCHPIEGGEEKGELSFHLKPEVAGQAKFYLQINRNGQEITFALPQHIQEQRKMVEKIPARSGGHHHGIG